MQNKWKRGMDMIPEIHDKFIVMNWLREQKHIHNDKFMRLPMCEQSRLINRTYMINDLIDKLKSEINEVAKEYGNSYLDDNGNTVWVKSEVKGE